MIILDSNKGGITENDISKKFKEDKIYYYIDDELVEKKLIYGKAYSFGKMIISLVTKKGVYLIPSYLVNFDTIEVHKRDMEKIKNEKQNHRKRKGRNKKWDTVK